MTLPFLQPDGTPLAWLTLQARRGTIQQVATDAALAWGEAPIQLSENGLYDFALTGLPAGTRLRPDPALTLSALTPHTGTIAPGLEAGPLPLFLDDAQGRFCATLELEVVASRLGYRQEFRALLEQLTAYALDLILSHHPAAHLTLTTRPAHHSPDSVQQLFLLLGVLGRPELENALHHLLHNPHSQLEPQPERGVLRQGIRSSALLQELVTGQPRRPVPADHALHRHGVATVPRLLATPHATPTVDTSENRFVRFALETFCRHLAHATVSLPLSHPLHRPLQHLDSRFTHFLQHPLWQEVGAASVPPRPTSPRWRRTGYRDMLTAFFRLQQALQLHWDGLEESLDGGRRALAQLYEYWTFLTLKTQVEAVFGVTFSLESLLVPTADGYALQLRSGEHTALQAPQLTLSYNRTFSPRAGESWTRAMRPDITLALTSPGTLPPHYLHFDAKYRSHDGDVLTEDLQAMHAYRDAIPGTLAAVVLYPGRRSVWWRRGDGLLPGLGAFPLQPTLSGIDGADALRVFLEAILHHHHGGLEPSKADIRTL